MCTHIPISLPISNPPPPPPRNLSSGEPNGVVALARHPLTEPLLL